MIDYVAHFCPQCGGASLEKSLLEGGYAACTSCGWKGSVGDLLEHRFKAETAEPVTGLMFDVRALISSNAEGWARLLRKWGFIDSDPKVAVRYLAAIGFNIFKALAETRDAIEREKVEHGTEQSN